jgi:hypothetical protein
MYNQPIRRRRILVCYSVASVQTSTTHSYITAFSKYAESEVYYLNVVGGVEPVVNLSQFDAVFISYCARLCIDNYVSKTFLHKLSAFDGVKAISIQDEYDSVNKELEALDFIRPDVVFTCIPEAQRDLIYPTSRYPNTQFIQVLTGYYEPTDYKFFLKPMAHREIDIGYRGREIGVRYGLLASQKADIAHAFKDKAAHKGLTTDISVLDSDRIYGNQWFNWLSNCKAVLGSQSGSNIFDFDGSISDACNHPLGPDQKTLTKIRRLDEQFSMGQISPRVFEAASVGSAQILYQGPYSGILEPNVHYIPVNTDNTNVDQILDTLLDYSFLERIARNAREDLIDSGNYSYQTFISKVESALFDREFEKADVSLPVRIAANHINLNENPDIEFPTLEPRSFDAFQLRQLLFSLRDMNPMEVVYRTTPRLRSAVMIILRNRIGRHIYNLYVRYRHKARLTN